MVVLTDNPILGDGPKKANHHLELHSSVRSTYLPSHPIEILANWSSRSHYSFSALFFYQPLDANKHPSPNSQQSKDVPTNHRNLPLLDPRMRTNDQGGPKNPGRSVYRGHQLWEGEDALGDLLENPDDTGIC